MSSPHTFACPAPLRPTASAPRAAIVGDRAHAEVVEVTAEGLVLAPRNGPWPGDVTVTVCVPFAGAHAAHAGVVAGADGTVVVKWTDPPADLLADLAGYLLTTRADVTPMQLRAAGLAIGSAVPAVRYEEVRGEDGIDEALALRLAAHQHEGRMTDLTVDDLRSPFDAHSWHVLGRHHGRLVLGSRLIMIEGDPTRSQYVSWSGHEVPQRLWDEGFVEIGAGAIDPAYQHAGLFVPIIQHLVRIAARLGTPHVLGAVPLDHLPRYDAMGFDLLETREVEPRPGWRFAAHLVNLDVPALLAGQRYGRLVGAMRDAALLGRAQA